MKRASSILLSFDVETEMSVVELRNTAIIDSDRWQGVNKSLVMVTLCVKSMGAFNIRVNICIFP